MVIPMYVTFSLTGILHVEDITQSLTANNSHLLRFRQRPDALENIFITSTDLEIWSASFKKRVVSSTGLLVMISLSAIEIPFILLDLTKLVKVGLQAGRGKVKLGNLAQFLFSILGGVPCSNLM